MRNLEDLYIMRNLEELHVVMLECELTIMV